MYLHAGALPTEVEAGKSDKDKCIGLSTQPKYAAPSPSPSPAPSLLLHSLSFIHSLSLSRSPHSLSLKRLHLYSLSLLIDFEQLTQFLLLLDFVQLWCLGDIEIRFSAGVQCMLSYSGAQSRRLYLFSSLSLPRLGFSAMDARPARSEV